MKPALMWSAQLRTCTRFNDPAMPVVRNDGIDRMTVCQVTSSACVVHLLLWRRGTYDPTSGPRGVAMSCRGSWGSDGKDVDWMNGNGRCRGLGGVLLLETWESDWDLGRRGRRKRKKLDIGNLPLLWMQVVLWSWPRLCQCRNCQYVIIQEM